MKIAAALAAAGAVAVLLGVGFLRSAWFRDIVRLDIIAAAEELTGGRVEMRAFQFDWSRLDARLDGFVIHGTEPKGAPPLFRASTVEVRLTLLPSLSRAVRLAYLGLDQPAVNIIVNADGSTNIPQPRRSRSGSPLSSVVNLAIGRFDIRSGTVSAASRRFRFDASGKNLSARLDYDASARAYRGRLSIDPLSLQPSGGPPLPVKLDLPLVIDKDGLSTSGARLTSASSSVSLSASLRRLQAPEFHLDLNGQVAAGDLRRALNLPLRPLPAARAPVLAVALKLTSTPSTLQVASARISAGGSLLEAAGPLRSTPESAGMAFKARLDAADLSLLADLPVDLAGSAAIQGNLLLDKAGYRANGAVETRSLLIRRGAANLSGIDGSALFRCDPSGATFSNLRLNALGGSFDGTLTLPAFDRWEVNGNFGGFSLARLARSFTSRPAGYDGSLTGALHAAGSLRNANIASVSAESRFLVAPASGSLPLSGRIDAVFTGASRSIVLTDSYITLPHSRADFSGALGKSVHLHLITTNLDDFLPALAFLRNTPTPSIPVRLNAGDAGVIADIIGPLSAPAIAGRVSANHVEVESRTFDRIAADVDASASGTTWRNGIATTGTLNAAFSGTLALRDWLPLPDSALTFHSSFDRASLADLVALSGLRTTSASGDISATADFTGTLDDPKGAVLLHGGPGSLNGQSFDALDATISAADRAMHLSDASLKTAGGQITASATFLHPPGDLLNGQLHLTAAAGPLAVSRIQPLHSRRPALDGQVEFRASADASVSAAASSLRFRLTALRGSLSMSRLHEGSSPYGNLSAAAQTSGSTLTLDLSSDVFGSHIIARSQTQLAPGYPSTLTATVGGLPIEDVFALAGYRSLPVEGSLSASVTLSGSPDSFGGGLRLSLEKARLYGEPLDSVTAGLRFSPDSVNVESASIVSHAGSVSLSGSFRHPPGAVNGGHLDLHLESTPLDLARIDRIEQAQPGLAGTFRLLADLTGDVGSRDGQNLFLLSRLNADAAATSLTLNRQPFGQASFHASSKGPALEFLLDSNIAGSTVHGSGNVRLEGTYPIEASLNFSNLAFSSFRALLGLPSRSRTGIDAAAEGRLSLSGPLLKPDSLAGSLELTRLNLTAPRRNSASGERVAILANDGPIEARLQQSALRITRARLAGRNSHLEASGSVAFNDRNPLNVSLDAAGDLAVLEEINRDVYAGGRISLKTAIRGTFAHPYTDGRIELHDVSLNLADIPNGISNANGVILLRGESASLQNVTGVTGGGKVAIGGSLDFSGGATRFGLKADAEKVRVRYQGASVLSNASLTLSGTGERSTLSGNVTVHRVAFSQETDLGSLLSITSTPIESPASPSPVMSAVRLDVRIRTAPDVRFQTNYTQRLEAGADLNLRGTLDRPSLLGRINVTQGEVIFFGNRYTVNQGTINFYNALKIEPVLNVSLETQAQGVDVVLGVSGPLDNMKLSYRSDPPLQFDEIVQLLALGTTPTSDATVVAHQPPPPQQSFGQMGESAIVGQAVATPLANRIQRVFGISQLRIDPAFTTGSTIPLARVTLQQQVSSNILFTYTTDLTAGNSQLVRVEWAISPRYSTVATRDENGIVSFDIFYKKQFR